MSQIKISELPLGIAENNAVVPATNAAGNQTNKIRLGDIVSLPHNHDDQYYTEVETNALLNDKAPLANPTFTGTVNGITKSMVGLGNVDNTSDINKPISSATQTALDLKANKTTVVNSTFASTINTNASSGDIFDITLTGNTTLANPTNPVNGKTLRWRITQDATGNRSVTLGSKFNIPSSATSPLPWSTDPNKMDTLAATYHEGRDKWDIVAFVPGY